MTRLLKAAKLKIPATVEDIDFRRPRGLDRAQILSLADAHYLEHHQSVVVVGPTGVGKTYVACALGARGDPTGTQRPLRACPASVRRDHHRPRRRTPSPPDGGLDPGRRLGGRRLSAPASRTGPGGRSARGHRGPQRLALDHRHLTAARSSTGTRRWGTRRSPTPCSTACSRRCTASSYTASPCDVPLLAPPTPPPTLPSLVANPLRSAHEGHGTPIAPNASFCAAPGGHEPRWLDPNTDPSSWTNAFTATTDDGRSDRDRLPVRDHQGGERQGIARTCRRPLCGLRPPVRRTCTKTSELVYGFIGMLNQVGQNCDSRGHVPPRGGSASYTDPTRLVRNPGSHRSLPCAGRLLGRHQLGCRRQLVRRAPPHSRHASHSAKSRRSSRGTTRAASRTRVPRRHCSTSGRKPVRRGARRTAPSTRKVRRGGRGLRRRSGSAR